MSGHQTSEEILLTLPASMYRIVQTYFQRTLNFTLCIEVEEQRAIYLHLNTIFSSQIDVSWNLAEQG